MARKPKSDPKSQALREQGSLNPKSRQVTDELFLTREFFDPRDLVQVKYEMLRRVQTEGHPVSRSASAFGFSRPSFYQAQAAFQQGGLPALTPQKRGPKQAHKLTAEVLAFLRQVRQLDPSLRAADLSSLVQDKYGISVHPRSIERAWVRSQKKNVGSKILTPSVASEGFVARYEQLRNGALSRSSASDFGLALFLRQGMIAWMMHACSCAVPAVLIQSAIPSHLVSPLRSDVRSQATLILAGIILNQSAEVTRCKAKLKK